METKKKAKICATLVMIYLILLIIEPIMFGTCFLFILLVIAMAIGLFIVLWSLLCYIFSEFFSYQKIRKKKDEKQQDC